MSRTTSAVAASTIGIDTGKHTLHLIGLDEQEPTRTISGTLTRSRKPYGDHRRASFR